jgi:hypothetical protein
MAIIRQPAYITKSPISVAIGGTVPAPFPPTPVIPAQDIQINGVLTGTGAGKWTSIIDYYNNLINGPTSFTFSDLEGTASSFLSTNASNIAITSLVSVSAPNLIYVGTSLLLGIGVGSSWTALTTADFPKLQFVGASIFNASNSTSANALTTLNLGSLVSVGGFGGVFNALTSVDVSKLQFIGSSGLPFVANSLTSLSLSSLVFCSGNISFTAPALTTLTMPSVLGTWKAMTASVILTSNALNQTSVDNLLAALAYMDGNNGTLLFGTGRSVTITGTSSTPSNLGSVTTPASQFSGVGTTCTVNWTNHGYANNDVLRISGITTLTGANGYFRITFVNANQFTYTMLSSQTATGVGTATVIKAGPDAKALVTRGVTLTTN